MIRTTATLWVFLLSLSASGGAMADAFENRCPVVTENHVTNERVAQLAESVLPRLKNWGVQAYARIVSNERRAASERIGKLVRVNGITPIDSPIAQSLRQQALDDRAALAGLSGNALARAYLDREIAMAETTLARMEQRWLRMATTPDLVAYLHDARADYTRYLEAARRFRSQLGLQEVPAESGFNDDR